MTIDVEQVRADLEAAHVWPQSIADHHADTLTPRQIERLYEVGALATRTLAALDHLTARVAEQDAEIERLRGLHAETAAQAREALAARDKAKPVAMVRVTSGGYGMSLAKYVAYGLPEGDHWLYPAFTTTPATEGEQA